MRIAELYVKMLDLHTRYKEALGEHNLGRAACARDDAAQLLAQEWDQINAALERAAQPLSYGVEQGDISDRCSNFDGDDDRVRSPT